jgi:hypothetical protein
MLTLIYFFHTFFTFNPSTVRIGDNEKFVKTIMFLGVVDLVLLIAFVASYPELFIR